MYKIDERFIVEKDNKSIILFELLNEVIYIFNESGSNALNALICNNNAVDAKEDYLKQTGYPETPDVCRDFNEFVDYLISENIIIGD